MLDRNPDKSMAELYDALPKTWGSPTMAAKCADEVKYAVVDRVVERFKALRERREPVAGQPVRDLITVNGVRVVAEDGTCEAKCDPAKCLQQAPMGDDPGFKNTCVNNKCQLVCTTQKDCFNQTGDNSGYLANTQTCASAVEDGTKAAVTVCQSNGKARGFGTPCPHGWECASDSAYFLQKACPNGAPVVRCPASAKDAIIAEVVSFLRGVVVVLIGSGPPGAGGGRSPTRAPRRA